MIDSYPTVSALLLAEVLDSLPARLRKKIDLAQTNEMADAGSPSADGAAFVVHQGTGTVTFTANHLATLEQVGCDCLLAPRCLHLAQALLRCEVSDSDPAHDATPVQDSLPPHESDPAQSQGSSLDANQATKRLSDAQLAVVHRAIAAFTTIIASGIAAKDPLHFSMFLRLSYEAKAQRLYLLGLRCGAVATLLSVKEVTTRDTRVDIVADGFLIAHKLDSAHSKGAITEALLGRPRKVYEPRASLSLHALFTEPIIASSGYAGVATYLRDAEGNLWNVSSNMPQDPAETPQDQARQYYRRAPRIGGISTGHFELTRRTLLVGNVKASDDGRLSAGSKVTAVAGSVKQWDPQWFEAEQERESILRYQRLTVKGMSGGLLALETAEGNFIALRATEAAQELGALDDFLELARHPGTELMCLIRPGLDGLDLLSFQVDPEQLSLPEAWDGRVMVGLDRLAPSFFKEPTQSITQVIIARGGPVTVMMGWLGRIVDHGRSAVVNDKSVMARDCERLKDVSSIHAAELLEELGGGSHTAKRDFDGTLIYLDGPMATAWLRLAAFTHAWSQSSH